MELPADIKQQFFEVLHGNKNVLEFEQWLYAEKRLESILSSDDYLDLISYAYKSDSAKYSLAKLLEKLIDKGEYEKWRLHKLLTKALQHDKEFHNILITFYDLYCKGYYFFDNLGLGYGLAFEVPYPQANYWDELIHEKQERLLNSLYPEIDEEIKKVINWLDNNKVIPTGQRDEYNHYNYIDNRTEEEKKPTAYKRT